MCLGELLHLMDGYWRALAYTEQQRQHHPPSLQTPPGHPVSRRTAHVEEREKDRERQRRSEQAKRGREKERAPTNPHGGWFSSPCKRPTVSVCARFVVGGGNEDVGGEPPRHIVNCPMETVVARGRTSTDLREYERSNYRPRPRLRLTTLGQKPVYCDLAFLGDEEANVLVFFSIRIKVNDLPIDREIKRNCIFQTVR